MRKSSSFLYISSLFICMPTTPTSTTLPFFLHIAKLCDNGSLLLVAAVNSTPSAPYPPLQDETTSSKFSFEGLIVSSAPYSLAICKRLSSKSLTATLTPEILSICTARSPKIPAPTTTQVSPSLRSIRLTPCIAMPPSVTVQARSKSISCGIFITKFLGTSTYSAWFASPAPAAATRSPISKFKTPSPTAMTTPLSE